MEKVLVSMRTQVRFQEPYKARYGSTCLSPQPFSNEMGDGGEFLGALTAHAA